VDLQFRNQQVAGSSPAGGSIKSVAYKSARLRLAKLLGDLPNAPPILVKPVRTFAIKHVALPAVIHIAYCKATQIVGGGNYGETLQLKCGELRPET
jgi:hypothetical protein